MVIAKQTNIEKNKTIQNKLTKKAKNQTTSFTGFKKRHTRRPREEAERRPPVWCTSDGEQEARKVGRPISEEEEHRDEEIDIVQVADQRHNLTSEKCMHATINKQTTNKQTNKINHQKQHQQHEGQILTNSTSIPRQ
jgi:hypothetical protein